MAFLVDTHAMIWWVIDDPRLPASVRQRIAEPKEQLVFSIASLWEITIKIRNGKLKEIGASIVYLRDYLKEAGIEVLPIKIDHLLRLEMLDLHHRDPFDRLLVAQALEENLPILTEDAAFSRYPVEVVW